MKFSVHVMLLSLLCSAEVLYLLLFVNFCYMFVSAFNAILIGILTFVLPISYFHSFNHYCFRLFKSFVPFLQCFWVDFILVNLKRWCYFLFYFYSLSICISISSK